MKTTLGTLAMALAAGSTMFAQPRVSIGIGIGSSYRAPVYRQVMPPSPGPGYAWVDGYWVPQGGRRVWINGYWHRAPRYVAPRYDNSYRDRDHRDYDRRDRDRDDRHDDRRH